MVKVKQKVRMAEMSSKGNHEFSFRASRKVKAGLRGTFDVSPDLLRNSLKSDKHPAKHQHPYEMSQGGRHMKDQSNNPLIDPILKTKHAHKFI